MARPFSLYESVDSRNLSIVGSLTAAGAGDNAEITGTSVDLQDVGEAVIAIAFRAALTNAQSLLLTVKIQESDDNSSFDTAEVLASAVTAKLADSSTTFYGVYELKIDLQANKKRKRYARFLVTPNLDAGATDTAIIAASLLCGSQRVKPVSHTV